MVGLFCSTVGGEALVQVDQGGGRCPVPGNIPGQIEWDYEQPDLRKDVLAHCSGVESDEL